MRFQALSSDGDADFIAPLADAGVADFEDGLVGPFLRSGGRRGAVDVVWRGIGDEVGVAAATVHEDVDGIQVVAIAVPAPADEDESAPGSASLWLVKDAG